MTMQNFVRRKHGKRWYENQMTWVKLKREDKKQQLLY